MVLLTLVNVICEVHILAVGGVHLESERTPQRGSRRVPALQALYLVVDQQASMSMFNLKTKYRPRYRN
jgi:hypothetical protein